MANGPLRICFRVPVWTFIVALWAQFLLINCISTLWAGHCREASGAAVWLFASLRTRAGWWRDPGWWGIYQSHSTPPNPPGPPGCPGPCRTEGAKVHKWRELLWTEVQFSLDHMNHQNTSNEMCETHYDNPETSPVCISTTILPWSDAFFMSPSMLSLCKSLCLLYLRAIEPQPGRGFRQTKSSCFSRTLIYHIVIPLISAASNISILKTWFIPPVQRGDDVLPCPRNWLSLPVSVSPSPHPSHVSETENKIAHNCAALRHKRYCSYSDFQN